MVITIRCASICVPRRGTGWRRAGFFAATALASRLKAYFSRTAVRQSWQGSAWSAAPISSTIWKRFSAIQTSRRGYLRSCSLPPARYPLEQCVRVGAKSPRFCSMRSDDLGIAEAATVARTLLGGSVDAIDRLQCAGRNSRIFRICRGGESFAVKHYPPRREDSRDRLRTEFEALALMRSHGIAVVPRPLASDAERNYALLSWVEGDAVDKADEPDIDAAADFLARLHQLGDCADAQQQPLGVEACLSGVEILAQLGRRLARLADVAEADPPLAALLNQIADWLLGTVLPEVTADYRLLGMSF